MTKDDGYTEPPVHVEGRNCWRVCRADHVQLIIDVKDYFTRLKAALRGARSQILMIGWDFDTRISLDGADGDESLGDFLLRLVRTNRSLGVYILKWNFGALKVLGRGAMIFTLMRWMAHPRIKLKFDSAHPVGASHHQKLIVIDGNLAFCGGIDVTSGRWDDRGHEERAACRRNPDGNAYDPWHDISIAVDGDAARALDELARTRWEHAGARPIAPLPVGIKSATPSEFTARNVNVAIARTRGEYKHDAAIRENETLFLDLIAGAQRHIYAETQYFACRKIARAIAQRLGEVDPPEIVLVMPEKADGWLEQVAMDSARAQLVGMLRKADVRSRFQIYHPFASGGTAIYVHAKLMIVDDRVLRVGSSNMNNRSMGFDSECDCLIDARSAGGEALTETIRSIRVSLLAEHLGESEEGVAGALRNASMIETIDRLSGPGRSLRPYVLEETGAIADFVASENLLDPIGDDGFAPEAIGRPQRWWHHLRRSRGKQA